MVRDRRQLVERRRGRLAGAGSPTSAAAPARGRWRRPARVSSSGTRSPIRVGWSPHSQRVATAAGSARPASAGRAGGCRTRASATPRMSGRTDVDRGSTVPATIADGCAEGSPLRPEQRSQASRSRGRRRRRRRRCRSGSRRRGRRGAPRRADSRSSYVTRSIGPYRSGRPRRGRGHVPTSVNPRSRSSAATARPVPRRAPAPASPPDRRRVGRAGDRAPDQVEPVGAGVQRAVRLVGVDARFDALVVDRGRTAGWRRSRRSRSPSGRPSYRSACTNRGAHVERGRRSPPPAPARRRRRRPP